MEVEKYRLLGAGERDDLVGRDVVVERSDRRAQCRQPERLGIAQPQRAPSLSRVVIRDLEQLRKTQRFAIRGAQNVLRGEFPFREIPLEREVCYLHLLISER